MNLYRIIFLHAGPKSQESGIKTYIISDSEEKVYKFVDKEYNCEIWKDGERDGDLEELDDEYIQLKDYLMIMKGNMLDNNYDDAYYAISKFGWEDMGKIGDFEANLLKNIGIVSNIL